MSMLTLRREKGIHGLSQCGSVVQCVAVLQCIAVRCSALQCVLVCVAVCVAVCIAHFRDGNVDVALEKQGKGIHHILQHCSVLQCVAECCSVL